MNAKVLTTLEYTRIRHKLSELTAFSASRELALQLAPASDIFTIERLQDETTQAAVVLEQRPEFGVRSAHNVRDDARRAALGGTLDPHHLLAVLDTIRSGQYVAGVLAQLDESYRRFCDVGAGIAPLRQLAGDIEQCLNDQGEVLDRASPALGRIRQDIKTAHHRLLDKVQSYLTSHRALLQDSIVTTRGDRYVVPVKAEYRSQVRGIVHDQSASGATFFIEPLEVMELNNTWRSLQIAERQEIERILRVLSEAVGKDVAHIGSTVSALAAVDLVLARAKLASLQEASRPLVNDRGEIDLLKARHPLLSGHVVPISVSLDHDQYMLVITGPNTGGKTVALKTIGLLTLMAQSGLQIPASEGSRLACFREVWADIGDEQSIEQSLSTFSSHMTNIVRLLKEVSNHDLVLLDELGAGTDPAEGSALARAILEFLRGRHVTSVATTHYSELKAYAHTQPGVQNASVEFDVETLTPTYRLIVGLPGRSNALAIARRLGIPPEILDLASGMLTPEQARADGMLEHIAAEERRAVAARRLAESNERAIAEARRRLERELADLEAQEDKIIESARRRAEEEVASTRRDLDRLLTDLQRSSADGQAQRQRVREADFDAAALLRQIGERRAPRRVLTPVPPDSQGAVPGASLLPGGWVRVQTLNQVARLVALNVERDEAEVQFGQMKAKVKVSDLIPATRHEAGATAEERERISTVVTMPSIPIVSMELDIRGQRPDDAAPIVERYVDDASLSGMPFVRIIHGKGTGALRTSVREQLTRHPLVKAVAGGDPREGGEGVTIVTFDR